MLAATSQSRGNTTLGALIESTCPTTTLTVNQPATFNCDVKVNNGHNVTWMNTGSTAGLSLQAPLLSGSYTLKWPQAAPLSSQFLAVDSVSPDQLVWTSGTTPPGSFWETGGNSDALLDPYLGNTSLLGNVHIVSGGPTSTPTNERILIDSLGNITFAPNAVTCPVALFTVKQPSQFDCPVTMTQTLGVTGKLTANGTITTASAINLGISTGNTTGTAGNITIDTGTTTTGTPTITIGGTNATGVNIGTGTSTTNIVGNLTLNTAGKQLTFTGTDNTSATHTITLQAPTLATGLTNYTILLPTTQGTNAQVLTTDGNNPAQLSWATIATPGNAFLNGGNTGFADPAVLGTTDSVNLQIITSNLTRIIVAPGGDITIGDSVTPCGNTITLFDLSRFNCDMSLADALVVYKGTRFTAQNASFTPVLQQAQTIHSLV